MQGGVLGQFETCARKAACLRIAASAKAGKERKEKLSQGTYCTPLRSWRLTVRLWFELIMTHYPRLRLPAIFEESGNTWLPNGA
jgi:hypothetical protein